MIIRLRDKDVNLDDELEFHYFGEYLTWLEYKRLEKNDYYDKFRNLHLRTFNEGNLDFLKRDIYSPRQDIFDNISKDGTIATSKNFGSKENLFIYVRTYVMRGSAADSVLSIPNSIYKKIKDNFDLIIISEDQLRYPESVYPSYLVLGTSKINNTFGKVVDAVNDLIKTDYKNTVIYGDSAHAGITISLANNIDKVTHALVSHGDVNYDFDTSPWVQEYLSYLRYREKLLSKDIFVEDLDSMIWNISSTRIRHIMKTFLFKKMKINSSILDPLSSYNPKKYKIDYYYGKYDTDWYPFLKHVKKFKEQINLHEVDWKYSETQTHFLAPYMEYKIIPNYIKGILDQ